TDGRRDPRPGGRLPPVRASDGPAAAGGATATPPGGALRDDRPPGCGSGVVRSVSGEDRQSPARAAAAGGDGGLVLAQHASAGRVAGVDRGAGGGGVRAVAAGAVLGRGGGAGPDGRGQAAAAPAGEGLPEAGVVGRECVEPPGGGPEVGGGEGLRRGRESVCAFELVRGREEWAVVVVPPWLPRAAPRAAEGVDGAAQLLPPAARRQYRGGTVL